MARAIICKGDPTSHGGQVLEGSADATIDGRPIALRGHLTYCPLCKGKFPISEGLDFHTFGGLGTAVEGMKTSCGAILIATQHQMTVDDQPGTAADLISAAEGHSQSGDGAYAPDDLRDAGYPQDARFIDTPTNKTGHLLHGATDLANNNPGDAMNALSRETYPFGNDTDRGVIQLIRRIDKKVPQNNQNTLVMGLQKALGMEGKQLTGFLDKNTYRAIRDWTAEFEARKSASMAESLLTQSIRPALHLLDLQSSAMENLLLGTAIHESGSFEFRKQTVGPALSFFQIEPDTANFYLSSLKKTDIQTYTKIHSLGSGNFQRDLESNDKFAAAIAAIIYHDRLGRQSISLPASDDIKSLAKIWKQLYNTKKGKGTAEQFISDWENIFKNK
ncbi:PAAR domain-containing protein [Massilia sp. YIM B04103]|uniref:PAAR domain-containing protein n=1 Tax=Massilia sp. YIM B04103 TaxID=2963106 RepID=UPI00210C8403|nr:PAAR domain-containing protein [Massilia sp. YIM B04103]